MRSFPVDFLVISADALGTADGESADGESLAKVAALRRTGIECLIVCEDEQPDIRLALAEIGCRTVRERTISIGRTRWDLGLAAASELHFHVGAADDVTGKVAGLVPLSGQGLCGTNNVLDWVARTGRNVGAKLVDHGDIVRFAQASSLDFHRRDKTRQAADLAYRLADRIQAEFSWPEAVIGGGFPFYSVDVSANGTRGRHEQVPGSILHYIDSQRDYFRSKVVPGDIAPSLTASRHELRVLGLEPDRNYFDVYEFLRESVDPPKRGPDRATIDEFVAANELDFASAIWPCHLCTELQDEARFPRQAYTRDFMHTCTLCRQTTLIPRNVGGVSCDVDLVIVAHGGVSERRRLGHDLARWVDAQDDLFRYDTDFEKALLDCEPPADVFVTSADELWHSCAKIAAGTDWHEVTLSSTALWLPITEHELGLGINFVLCAEPIWARHPEWHDRFAGIRRAFARAVPADEVIAKLSAASFYHEQLMSNASINQLVLARLRHWSTTPPR